MQHRISTVEGIALLDLPFTGEGEIKILIVLRLLKRLLTGKTRIDTPFSHIDSFTFIREKTIPSIKAGGLPTLSSSKLLSGKPVPTP